MPQSLIRAEASVVDDPKADGRLEAGGNYLSMKYYQNSNFSIGYTTSCRCRRKITLRIYCTQQRLLPFVEFPAILGREDDFVRAMGPSRSVYVCSRANVGSHDPTPASSYLQYELKGNALN